MARLCGFRLAFLICCLTMISRFAVCGNADELPLQRRQVSAGPSNMPAGPNSNVQATSRAGAGVASSDVAPTASPPPPPSPTTSASPTSTPAPSPPSPPPTPTSPTSTPAPAPTSASEAPSSSLPTSAAPSTSSQSKSFSSQSHAANSTSSSTASKSQSQSYVFNPTNFVFNSTVNGHVVTVTSTSLAPKPTATVQGAHGVVNTRQVIIAISSIGGSVVLSTVAFAWIKLYKGRRAGWDDDEIATTYGDASEADPFKNTLDQYHRS